MSLWLTKRRNDGSRTVYVAERFFRTLKEQLLWVEDCRTVADLAAALEDFRVRYNHSWLLERHGHRTPAEVRAQLTALDAA